MMINGTECNKKVVKMIAKREKQMENEGYT